MRYRNGYVMMLTLILIALMTILVTYMSQVAHTYAPYALTAQEQLKARMMALSGIEITKAQLANAYAPAKDKKESPEQRKKRFLGSLLRMLNTQQTFSLTKQNDGLDAKIKLYLSCEEGKLNLNNLWDADKQQLLAAFLKGPEQDGLKGLFSAIERFSQTNDLLVSWTEFMKKRKELLNDVTELILIQQYKTFAESLFLNAQQKDTLFLTDLFTLWNPRTTIDPLVFSTSWIRALGLSRSVDAVEQLLKVFTTQNSWKTAWDKVFGSFYEKNFNSLPKSIDSMLTTTFDPHFFSVVSCGEVGSSTVMLFAILELNEQKKEETTVVDIVVRKLYWL